MFACIYFKEDATLGVVGRNDKNLKVLSEFLERQEVEMHWKIGGKLQLYHGQIIKVHENEEVLTKFAKRADSKVLKRLRTEVDGHGKIDTSETPQELFNLMLTEEAIGSKRKPKPTEKSKESTEQEETLSPKKKKKNEEKAHVVQSKKEKAEKGNVYASKFETKKMEGASSLQAESEIAGLLSQLLPVDTHNSTESESNLTTCIDDNASSLVKDDAVPHSAVTSQKGVHVVQSPTPTDIVSTPVLIPTPKFKDVVHFPKLKHSTPVHTSISTPNDVSIQKDSVKPRDISITETWGVICETTQPGKIPVPNTKVLDGLKALLDPEVFTYIRKVVNHFEQNFSQCAHRDGDCFEESGELSNFENYNLTDISSASVLHVYEPASEGEVQYDQEYNEFDKPFPTLIRNSPRKPVTETIRRSPRKHATPMRMSPTNSPQTPRSAEHATPMRRSPTKSPQSPRSSRKSLQEATDNVEVKDCLLKIYPDVKIVSAVLTSAVATARKSLRPGYTLCYNLIGGIFTIEELANSKGQGLIKANPGDTRPVLNKEKCAAVKEYTVRWCKKQEKPLPTEAELNNAFTEKVSQCRKKLKKMSNH